jgi:hypothetical protein
MELLVELLNAADGAGRDAPETLPASETFSQSDASSTSAAPAGPIVDVTADIAEMDENRFAASIVRGMLKAKAR